MAATERQPEWRVVQTDAGPVMLAARARKLHDWATTTHQASAWQSIHSIAVRLSVLSAGAIGGAVAVYAGPDADFLPLLGLAIFPGSCTALVGRIDVPGGIAC